MQLSDNWLMKAPLLDTRAIHSLTDFLRNHKAHVARLKKTQAPEVLTVNGKAAVIVQDAASYQLCLTGCTTWRRLRSFRKGWQAPNGANGNPLPRCLTRCGPNMAYRLVSRRLRKWVSSPG